MHMTQFQQGGEAMRETILALMNRHSRLIDPTVHSAMVTAIKSIALQDPDGARPSADTLLAVSSVERMVAKIQTALQDAIALANQVARP